MRQGYEQVKERAKIAQAPGKSFALNDTDTRCRLRAAYGFCLLSPPGLYRHI